jgi:UDP-glucose 4-epimerase
VRVLVTGGAGFIGSSLVDRLLAEGHTVDVVDDLTTGSLGNLADARATAGHQLAFHQLDVRSPDLEALLQRRRPEIVYHLAGRPGVVASVADPVLDAEVNVVGSVRVLEAARRAGAVKVVYASGGPTMYGAVTRKELPTREAHAQRPLAPYGVANKAVTDYLHAYRELHALEFTSLAFANVYGPRQDPRGGAVVAVFASRLLAEEPCLVNGDGRQTRDFLYIDDAVDALARASTRGSGLLLNVGTGVETSVNELYRLVASVIGAAGPASAGPGRPGELGRAALDPTRAGLHLGWTPWTTLADGVGATVDWFRGRGA